MIETKETGRQEDPKNLPAPDDPQSSNDGGYRENQAHSVSAGIPWVPQSTNTENNGNACFFDWYQASVLVDWGNLRTQLESAGVMLRELGYGRNGYRRVYEGILADGTKLTICATGNNGAPPNVTGFGYNAPRVAALLRSLPWPHRVTRVDSTRDYTGVGAWEALDGYLEGYAREHRLLTSVAGDWLTPGSPRGRTLYIGGTTSPVRLRLYEKGKKEQDSDFSWTRLELVVRPQREQRDKAATATPDEMWGYAKWPREVYQTLFGGLPDAVQAPSRRSNDELNARLIKMIKRNGKLFSAGLTKYGTQGFVDLVYKVLSV